MATIPPAIIEFAFPGPLRDQLVGAVLAGSKTSTTTLLVEYEHCREPLPRPGDHATVIDSDQTPVAVIRTVSVEVTRLAEVDLQHAIDEGEGFTDIASWRTAHEACWRSKDWQAVLPPSFTPSDETAVVLERFSVVERL
jgi:uncharacterized protein YhfF